MIGLLRVGFLRGGIRIRSLSLRRDGFPGRWRPEFGLGHTLLVLRVVGFIALGVLREEFHSQFGHLCRVLPLVFWINVLLLEFFFGENCQFGNQTEMIPGVFILERIGTRSLVIVKDEPKECLSPRRRGEFDGQEQIEEIDIQPTKVIMCHGLRQPAVNNKKENRDLIDEQ